LEEGNEDKSGSELGDDFYRGNDGIASPAILNWGKPAGLPYPILAAMSGCAG
jgi:hypothetical protein